MIGLSDYEQFCELLKDGDYYEVLDRCEPVEVRSKVGAHYGENLRTWFRAQAFASLRAMDSAYAELQKLREAGGQQILPSRELSRFWDLCIRCALRSGRIGEAWDMVGELPANATKFRNAAAFCDPNDLEGRLHYLLAAERVQTKANRSISAEIVDVLIRLGQVDEAGNRLEKLATNRKSAATAILAANLHNELGQMSEWAGAVSACLNSRVLRVSFQPTLNAFERFQRHTSLPDVLDGPRVCVVMTAFNASETIGYAIESVLSQTYKNIRLFVVDDCSVDNTADIVERIATSDSRLTLIRNRVNSGTYVSKNQVLACEPADYYALHDSDDLMLPDRIEAHVRFMEKNSQRPCSSSMWMRMTESGRFVTTGGGNFEHTNPGSTFIRSSVFERIGYFDGVRAGGDSEFAWRLRRVFGPRAIAPIKQILTIGLSSATSLTGGGETGYDSFNYSGLRLAYSESWLAWHRNTKELDQLHIPYPLVARKFACPERLAVFPTVRPPKQTQPAAEPRNTDSQASNNFLTRS